jgi:hypothetical protein
LGGFGVSLLMRINALVLLASWHSAAVLAGQLTSQQADDAIREAALLSGIGTTAFQADIHTKSGELFGCGWSFTHVLFDHQYRQGRPSVLNGSLTSLYHPGRPPSLILKLVGTDLDGTRDGQVQRTYFPIPLAYLETEPGVTTAKSYITTYECENKAFCGVFVEHLENVLDAFSSGHIIVGYQRKSDGTDVRFGLDPSKLPNHATELKKGWECMGRLMKVFEKDLEDEERASPSEK